MQKMLLLGFVLSVMSSCGTGEIKEPQPFFVISTKFMTAAEGKKSFNHKKGVDQIGEWVGEVKEISWQDMPENLACTPLEVWLRKLKTALKDFARKYRDQND